MCATMKKRVPAQSLNIVTKASNKKHFPLFNLSKSPRKLNSETNKYLGGDIASSNC